MNPTTDIRKRLPADFADRVAGYDFRQIHLGLSPAEVFRLDARDEESLYLKIAPRLAGFSLRQEKSKLEWLENRLPVPKVLLFAREDRADYLLLSEIAGQPASDSSLKNDAGRVIRQLAAGLKMIHAVPLEGCPFDARLDCKIKTARERMVRGLVEEDDFEEVRQGRPVEDLFRELLATKPSPEDLVFTHGDYCLPNVILENGTLSGFIDWGSAGIADRYHDIALLERSIKHNFGAEWTKILFETLGAEPDRQKIDFYQLLDEFF
jgi:aminoglycoside phosphotransferase